VQRRLNAQEKRLTEAIGKKEKKRRGREGEGGKCKMQKDAIRFFISKRQTEVA